MIRPKICVVGACNVDLTSYAPRMPKWGETLRGSHFTVSCGGKGANQALMAAKLGARVAMVGKIGLDQFGDKVIQLLDAHEIDRRYLLRTDQSHTGTAQILVNEKGENAITVITGASDLVTPADIEKAKEKIEQAGVLLLQGEIPINASLAAMKIAERCGTQVVFNPAPMSEGLPEAIFPFCDILCLNETEAESLTNMSMCNEPQRKAALEHILEKGAKNVVLTRGGNGVLFTSKDFSLEIMAPKVAVLDTTGAGDCFIGSFSYFKALGKPIRECCEKAVQIAALSVQGKGTHDSYPNREELKKMNLDV